MDSQVLEMVDLAVEAAAVQVRVITKVVQELLMKVTLEVIVLGLTAPILLVEAVVLAMQDKLVLAHRVELGVSE